MDFSHPLTEHVPLFPDIDLNDEEHENEQDNEDWIHDNKLLKEIVRTPGLQVKEIMLWLLHFLYSVPC